MPRVVFTAPFTYRANRRALLRYSAGKAYNVVTKCAEQAVAAGKAYREPVQAEPGAGKRRRASDAEAS